MDTQPPATDLEQSWTYKLTVLADRIARHSAAIAAEVGGLNLSQWRVLAAIADREGRTASDVVAMTPMDKGIVSRAVASLCDQGLLRRRASEQDGRRSHLFMTAKGRTVFTRIDAARAVRKLDGRDALSDVQRTALLSVLDRLIADYP